MVDSFALFENNLNESPMNYVNENRIRQKWLAHFVALGITSMLLPYIIFAGIQLDKNGQLIFSFWE